MARKFGFSIKPWRRKQRQLKQIEANRVVFERERQENKTWKRRKAFNSNRYMRSWAKYKDDKEKLFTELTLNSLSVCDAATEVNEALFRGLGLKETAIDIDAVEDLTYNIYMIKLSEILCGAKGANLSKSVADKVITALISQIFPPSVPQKPVDSRRGEKLIEELAAIRSSARQTTGA